MIDAIEIDRDTGQIMTIERAELPDSDACRIIDALLRRPERREESA